MGRTLMQDYLRQLNAIYEGDIWAGESFSKKLNNLTEEEAFLPPAPGVHSVAEIFSHLLEWRKELIERFETGRAPKLTMESDHNWYGNKILREAGWDSLKEEFEKTQGRIIQIWEGMDDSFLEKKYHEEYPFHDMVEGVIHHDLYHLGQMGLIISMIRKKAGESVD